jgi:hypothetical protein
MLKLQITNSKSLPTGRQAKKAPIAKITISETNLFWTFGDCLPDGSPGVWNLFGIRCLALGY